MPTYSESYIATLKGDHDALEGRVSDVETAISAQPATYTEAETDALLADKAPTANPVFTGTVTVPDGALAIADTNGLQAALDGKMPTGYLVLPRTMADTVTVPTGSDIYLPFGVTVAGQITLQGDARVILIQPQRLVQLG